MGMEDETRRFFLLIVNSIALFLLWMIANMLVGIYWGYAFAQNEFTWKNALYYLISVSIFICIILRIKRNCRL